MTQPIEAQPTIQPQPAPAPAPEPPEEELPFSD